MLECLTSIFHEWFLEECRRYASQQQQHNEQPRVVDVKALTESELNTVVNRVVGISHFDAIRDPAYVRKYYPIEMAVMNMGGLTLVAPEWFPFARKLVSLTSIFDSDWIKRKGNEAVSSAFAQVENNPTLQWLFERGYEEHPEKDCEISEETRGEIARLIISKSFHALVGRKIKDFVREEGSRKLGSQFRKGLKATSIPHQSHRSRPIVEYMCR